MPLSVIRMQSDNLEQLPLVVTSSRMTSSESLDGTWFILEWFTFIVINMGVLLKFMQKTGPTASITVEETGWVNTLEHNIIFWERWCLARLHDLHIMLDVPLKGYYTTSCIFSL